MPHNGSGGGGGGCGNPGPGSGNPCGGGGGGFPGGGSRAGKGDGGGGGHGGGGGGGGKGGNPPSGPPAGNLPVPVPGNNYRLTTPDPYDGRRGLGAYGVRKHEVTAFAEHYSLTNDAIVKMFLSLFLERQWLSTFDMSWTTLEIGRPMRLSTGFLIIVSPRVIV